MLNLPTPSPPRIVTAAENSPMSNISNQYSFEVIFTALAVNITFSRRGRSAKSYFLCVVYRVLARYSILFGVHV